MKARGQTFVLSSRQVILTEILQTSLSAVESHLLFVLPTAVVVLQRLVEHLLKLFDFALLDILIDLVVK